VTARTITAPPTLDTAPTGTSLARRALAWIREEVVYRRSLSELRRLDDRDLDDLNLGRGDLPVLARRHARAITAARQAG
jgi:uncharacterized protein YjiS (DUF1127 family)